MNASLFLVAFIGALFLHDLVQHQKNRRMLLLQALVFGTGAVFVVKPELAQRLANAVGIGRGVDFVLYLLVIWLVRESLLSRRRRHFDQAKMTELVRSVASANAIVLQRKDRNDPQSPGASAS